MWIRDNWFTWNVNITGKGMKSYYLSKNYIFIMHIFNKFYRTKINCHSFSTAFFPTPENIPSWQWMLCPQFLIRIVHFFFIYVSSMLFVPCRAFFFGIALLISSLSRPMFPGCIFKAAVRFTDKAVRAGMHFLSAAPCDNSFHFIHDFSQAIKLIARRMTISTGCGEAHSTWK